MYDRFLAVVNRAGQQAFQYNLRRPGGNIPLLGEVAGDGQATILDGPFDVATGTEEEEPNTILSGTVLAIAVPFTIVNFRLPDDTEIITILFSVNATAINLSLRIREG